MGFLDRVIDLVITTLLFSMGAMYLIFRGSSEYGTETASLLGAAFLFIGVLYLLSDYSTEFWMPRPNPKLQHWALLLVPLVILIFMGAGFFDVDMFQYVWPAFIFSLVIGFVMLLIYTRQRKAEDVALTSLVAMGVLFVAAALIWYLEPPYFFGFNNASVTAGFVIAGVYAFFAGVNATAYP